MNAEDIFIVYALSCLCKFYIGNVHSAGTSYKFVLFYEDIRFLVWKVIKNNL